MINWIKKKIFVFRWRDITRQWPVKRFMPTIDLDLTEAEQRELEMGIHSWRQLVAWYMARFGGVPEDGAFYCFGVAHGSTVDGLVHGLRNRDMPVPKLHLFDSFEGLPEEDEGISRPSVWDSGAYAAPRQKLEGRIQQLGLADDDYQIHEGWFSETLKDELVENGVFAPAAYVDIDADLYNSTRDVLEFFFRHKLIRPGTLIGYDDWGDTELWTAGESRAHKELTEKYGARCAQLFSWGERPNIKKLFLVVSIDE